MPSYIDFEEEYAGSPWGIATDEAGVQSVVSREQYEANAVPPPPLANPPAEVGPIAGPPAPPPQFQLSPTQQTMMGVDESDAPVDPNQGPRIDSQAAAQSGHAADLRAEGLQDVNPGQLTASPLVDPGSELLTPGGMVRVPGESAATTARNEVQYEEPAGETVGRINQSFDDLQEAERQERVAAHEAEIRATQTALQQTDTRIDELTSRAEQARLLAEDHGRVAQSISDSPIDTDWTEGSWGREVAAWIALAISGFLTGVTRGRNPALQQTLRAFDAAQDRFMAAQKARRDSQLRFREQAIGDAVTAERTIQMQLGPLMQKQIKLQAQAAGLHELNPALSTIDAKLEAQRLAAVNAVMMRRKATVARTVTEHERLAQRDPVFRRDRQLRSIGVDAKEWNAVMDPKDGNLVGLVQARQDTQAAHMVLKGLAAEYGGTLPSQNVISIGRGELSRMLGAAGVELATDARLAQQQLEKVLLSVKQTLNIKSIDSENEGQSFRLTLDSGITESTMAAVAQIAERANGTAIGAAARFAGDPQALLDIIQSTIRSNPGVRSGIRTFRPSPGGVPEPTATEEQIIEAEGPPRAGGGGGGGPRREIGGPGGLDIDVTQDPEFVRQLGTALEQGIGENVDVQALLRLIRKESGGDPGQPGLRSSAQGLIQFMPFVAEGLGTSKEKLAKMSGVEQIPYIVEYLKNSGVKPGAGAGEMYLAIAAPAALLQDWPDDKVVYAKGTEKWRKNRPWHPPDGGDITVASIKAAGEH